MRKTRIKTKKNRSKRRSRKFRGGTESEDENEAVKKILKTSISSRGKDALENLKLVASKMKQNPKNVDINELEQALNNVANPLHHFVFIDESVVKGRPVKLYYTINELALRHFVNPQIHALFCKYDVDLNHFTDYNTRPKINYSNGAPALLNLLEAYCSYNLYHRNISCILDRIMVRYEANPNDSMIFDCFFRHTDDDTMPPNLLYIIIIHSSTFIRENVSNMMQQYNRIIDIYCIPDNFARLIYKNTNDRANFNEQLFINVLGYAINSNYAYAVERVCDAFIIKEGLIHNNLNGLMPILLNFAQYILVVDTIDIYITTMKYIRTAYTQEHELLLQLLNSPNEGTKEILEEYIELFIESEAGAPALDTPDKYAKRFFEKYATLVTRINFKIKPDIKKPSFIIVCHGSIYRNDWVQFDFPFRQLCFFGEKGKMISDSTCHYYKNMSNNICNGNIDQFECIVPINNKIPLEKMRLTFYNEANINPRLLGIFFCENDEPKYIRGLINNKLTYGLDDIISKCLLMCNHMNRNPNDIDIKLFSCRSYIGEENETTYTRYTQTISNRSPVKPKRTNVDDYAADIYSFLNNLSTNPFLPKDVTTSSTAATAEAAAAEEQPAKRARTNALADLNEE